LIPRRFQKVIITAIGAVVATTLVLALCAVPAGAQSSAYQVPRTKDGRPDLSGIWQAINTANWDLQAHAAQAGHVVALGAQGAEPGGVGVIEGGEIPYLPAALAQKKANYEKRFTDDPEIKCYMPGVPRATYLPFPFQILQSQKVIQISYEFAATARTIFMEKMPPAPLDSWMGQSIGHWEGDTLVVDVTSLLDQTWLDRAGDFHSDALHVIERYTPLSRDVLQYEATIEDPKVFSRPWKIRMPLYRHIEKDARLMEFRCAQFVEELLYGQYRKTPAQK
jgi:hypothetical protein